MTKQKFGLKELFWGSFVLGIILMASVGIFGINGDSPPIMKAYYIVSPIAWIGLVLYVFNFTKCSMFLTRLK